MEIPQSASELANLACLWATGKRSTCNYISNGTFRQEVADSLRSIAYSLAVLALKETDQNFVNEIQVQNYD